MQIARFQFYPKEELDLQVDRIMSFLQINKLIISPRTLASVKLALISCLESKALIELINALDYILENQTDKNIADNLALLIHMIEYDVGLYETNAATNISEYIH